MSPLTIYILFIAGLLCSSFALGINNCSESQFPCDSGEQCVSKNQWCDSVEDCHDDSDEEHCHFSTYFNKDPNYCKGTKLFICTNGPCIPFSGRCDGVPSCSDHSDEDNCENSTIGGISAAMENSSIESALKTGTPMENFTAVAQTTNKTTSKITTSITSSSSQQILKSTRIFTTNSPNTEDSIPVLPLQDYPMPKSAAIRYPVTKDQESARMKAHVWLLNQQDISSGIDVARTIVALHLSNETFFSGDSKESRQMTKQLQLQLSLDIIRNETRPMNLCRLALYVNALLASCSNPHDFHGVDLVNVLRLRTDSAIMAKEFVSPAVYLTLCIVRKGCYHDVDKLRELFVTQDKQLLRLDIQALAVLAASCYSKIPEFSSLSTKLYGTPNLMLDAITNATFTDVYTTALLIQAFATAGVTSKDWRRAEALDFLLSSQNTDGSFGDVLATYYAMPSLSGNDLESLKNPCYITDGRNGSSSMEFSEEWQSLVHISLGFGNPVESALTLQLKVEEEAQFLDVLKMARNHNPQFSLKYDQLTTVPIVYSVGDIPNDAERGMFWNLYVEERKYPIIEEKILGTLTPFMEDIQTLTLKNGSHIIFWFKEVLV